MKAQAGQEGTEPIATPELKTKEQRSPRKFESSRSWFKTWIGYDPQVVEAASVSDTLSRAFRGNVVHASGSYLHSLFPIVDVSSCRKTFRFAKARN